MFSGIISALRQVFLDRLSSLDSATAKNSNEQHHEILNALEAHDPVLARQKMEEHLNNIHDAFIS